LALQMGSRFRKTRITAGVVDRLKPGETVMDVEEPGFGVRRQGDARVFFLRKHARGRRHFVTIGECGTGGLTVTGAREKAKRQVVAIRDGLSPAERRARERGMPTVGELAEDWLKMHVDAKLKASTAGLYRSTLRSTILPVIAHVRVDQLSDDHVSKMHLAARKVPYAANRALAIVSKMMSFAERAGLRPRGTNPVKGLERYKEEKRERFLSREQREKVTGPPKGLGAVTVEALRAGVGLVPGDHEVARRELPIMRRLWPDLESVGSVVNGVVEQLRKRQPAESFGQRDPRAYRTGNRDAIPTEPGHRFAAGEAGCGPACGRTPRSSRT
jgi:hypothetical protein